MTTTTGQTPSSDADTELYERARGWMWDQGECSWVADAFGHWVIAEVAPHGRVPERLTALWVRWNYDPVPRAYRARHGVRLSGSPRWSPGDPLPDPPGEHRS